MCYYPVETSLKPRYLPFWLRYLNRLVKVSLLSAKVTFFSWFVASISFSGVSNYVSDARKLCADDIRSPLYVDNAGGLRYLCLRFNAWRQENVFLAFKKEASGQYFFSKASKRGNDVYSKRVLERFEGMIKSVSTTFTCERKDRSMYRSNCLFVTLTVNPDTFLFSRARAWQHVEKQYSRFIAQFRKKFGRCFVCKVIEAQEGGYPHYHLLIIAKKKFLFFESNRKLRWVHSETVGKMWCAGFSDVSGFHEFGSAARYVRKYLSKFSEISEDYDDNGDFAPSKGTISLAMCWLFRKRAFSISDSKSLDLIRSSSITHPEVSPKVAKIDMDEWEFLGLVCCDKKFSHAFLVLSDEQRDNLDLNLLR